MAEIEAAVADSRAGHWTKPSLGVVLDTNVWLSGLADPASVPGNSLAFAPNPSLHQHPHQAISKRMPAQGKTIGTTLALHSPSGPNGPGCRRLRRHSQLLHGAGAPFKTAR